METVKDALFRDAGESGGHRLVDREQGVIAYWGDWWYRGEDTVTAHPQGTLLRHRVYNIARQGNWAPYLANKMFIGYRARLEASLRDRIAQLETQL
ncbi:hypothetical protein BBK82_36855 [Lentzea guizhouensis]|uniref:Uncharacterized protein n=1 Tax=Lentzea guizhouensis TaxID=1586287 RepID=A0A1B2I030_9PSEU|nr:hypothetical protein BBK82_36855 [Lentzea guizhouensis]